MEMYYNRTDLINLTTETVHENLLVGMCLVSVILLMFLNNIRVAIIVALNIPLALLFAFGILFLRGKSANLLSIGAVDFGIIVDSAVILVESIYRHLTHGEYAELPFEQRIIKACAVVERSIFFSTLVMVCALLPLFTMKGPEGQIFGPMADTYAFALGGALLLAMTISPVLCCCILPDRKRVKPTRDNFPVLCAASKPFTWDSSEFSSKCAGSPLPVFACWWCLPDGKQAGWAVEFMPGIGRRQHLHSRHVPDQHVIPGSGGAQSAKSGRFCGIIRETEVIVLHDQY